MKLYISVTFNIFLLFDFCLNFFFARAAELINIAFLRARGLGVSVGFYIRCYVGNVCTTLGFR